MHGGLEVIFEDDEVGADAVEESAEVTDEDREKKTAAHKATVSRAIQLSSTLYRITKSIEPCTDYPTRIRTDKGDDERDD